MARPIPRYPHHALGWFAGALDSGLTIGAGPIAAAAYSTLTGIPVSFATSFGLSLLVGCCFVGISIYRGMYQVETLLDLDRQIRVGTFHWCASFAAMIAVAYLMKSSADFSRGATAAYFGVAGLWLFLARICGYVYLKRELAKGGLKPRRVALLSWGVADLPPGYERYLPAAGFEVGQRVVIQSAESIGESVACLLSSIRGTDIDEIFIALPHHELGALPPILQLLRSTPLKARLIPDEHLADILTQRRRGHGHFSLVEIKREPLSLFERAAKRALDLSIAAGAILALLPLFAIAMIAIKLDTPGPVLFNQSRRGFNGRTFRILKLRTMHVMEDGPQVVQTVRHDTRVTRVGRWLRTTSIDELPQLWNVLTGKMSIVGPRPHAVAHDDYYDQLIENYAFRQHVKPGLTGWAQVNGYRGETPRVDDMEARIEHDLWYINNWSFGLDLRIILLTFARLLSQTAY